MDIEVKLPPVADTLSPIFVVSPCNHSGGALLQRAVCESENGFCYGDNLFDEITSLLDWSVGLLERHQKQKSIEEDVLKDALERAPSKWMPELAPEFDLYMASLFSSVFNLPFTAQDFAKQNGRDVWMVTRASVPAWRLNDLLSIFPKSKAIIIYRNPLDIVRDALRDRPETNIRDVCELWNASMKDFLSISIDRILKLKYEDATEQTEAFLSHLEDFTDIRGLRNDTIACDNEAETDSQYELGQDLKVLVQKNCEDMLAVYYPHLVT